MCPWHFALPAGLCAGSALGVRGVFASLFDQGGLLPKKRLAAASTHSKSPATAGRNTTDKICASSPREFVLWRTAKTFIDSASKLPQLGGFSIAAFELEDHAFNVLVILVPPQEL